MSGHEGPADLARALNDALAPHVVVERELGRGGMATVFLARDRKHDRHVAVKVMRPGIAADLGADRFLREIRLTARFTHPHILPLLDSGRRGDLLYYVMPFVSGDTIRQRLDRHGPFPVAEAVALAREVADALDYAHAAGVLHRDVKPENVLLLEGHAVVLDFGLGVAIASAVNADASITSAGYALGTPTYLSPEQAAGETELDGRSDEYALALMLHEMLTGAPVFSARSASAVIAQRFVRTPARLSSVRPEVSGRVSDAVQRALSTEREDRYATLAEFARALGEAPAGGAPARGERPSIAILPFTNVSTEPENEHLSDGLTDEVIGTLARLRTLRVAARTSSYAFKGRHVSIPEIGERLNVRTILEGSVRRAGTRIRVSVQLVNAGDGFQLWAATFDRELGDVFAIQDEISEAISANLEMRLLAGAGAPAPAVTTSPEALELYLRGRQCWNRRTEEQLDRSIEYFTGATRVDPSYALAHAGLADAYAVLGVYGARASTEVMPRALECAGRALDLDASLPQAHATLGLVRAVFHRDWAAAGDAFRRAVTLGPGYPTARQWRAVSQLVPQRRFSEALEELEGARAVDPLSPVIGSSVGIVHSFARDHERAIAAHRSTISLEPAFTIGHFFLAQALAAAGRHAEALASLDQATAPGDGSPEMRALGAACRAATGDAGSARAALEALRQSRDRRHVSACLLAQVHAALAEPDEAHRWLDRALEERDPELIYLGVRPAYDALRGTDRFRGLLSAAGIP